MGRLEVVEKEWTSKDRDVIAGRQEGKNDIVVRNKKERQAK